MGLETAKLMGRDYQLIIADTSETKLEQAMTELNSVGTTVHTSVCDISKRDQVRDLAAFAREKGPVKAVIQTAGLSPNMGAPFTILMVNAAGTYNVCSAFYEVMDEGSCLIAVSSMAAHLAPSFIFPRSVYPLCAKDLDRFINKLAAKLRFIPKKYKSALAYCFSKDFIIWLVQKEAERFGDKGIRILSVSPGNFDTPMGMIEKAEGEKFTARSALKRFGKPEEIAHLFAFCVDERVAYLTGTDILMDGGTVAYRRRPALSLS